MKFNYLQFTYIVFKFNEIKNNRRDKIIIEIDI